jgi:hypothetical protein
MGQKMNHIKMKALTNPIGILYNPESMHKVLLQVDKENINFDATFIQRNGLWHSLMHHSQFSHPERKILKHRIEQAHSKTKNALQKSKWLVLTFGTAFTYRHLERDIIVGNCHKIPGKEFLRNRLNLDACVQSIEQIVRLVKKINPDISILCTVSPIRHLRDGLVENQKSKATLLLAIDQIIQRNDSVHYFPSYEILMDDLRDYRFYAKDLTHPSETAIDYIWSIFSNAILSDDSKKLSMDVLKIKQAQNHRPLQYNTKELDSFAKQQLQSIALLKQGYDMLDFDVEQEYFRSLLYQNSD